MFLILVKVPSHIVFLPPYSFTLEHPQIIKYFKGVYNLRPPTPITFVWDVKIMLNYFSHKGEMTSYQIKGENGDKRGKWPAIR